MTEQACRFDAGGTLCFEHPEADICTVGLAALRAQVEQLEERHFVCKAIQEHSDQLERKLYELEQHVEEQARVIGRLREALEEISEGKGRFSRDNFEHCRNTVEDMKALAIEALSPMESKEAEE